MPSVQFYVCFMSFVGTHHGTHRRSLIPVARQWLDGLAEVAVFAYLQVQKWRHASEAVADGQPDGEPVLAPSAPPKTT